MRLDALKFLCSMETGMSIIAATLWTVSIASAGCLPRHVSVLDIREWEIFHPLGERSISETSGHVVSQPGIRGGWNREEASWIESWWSWSGGVSQ